MIWLLLRLVSTVLVLILIYFKTGFILSNFESNLMHYREERLEEDGVAVSFCSDFYHVYKHCGQKISSYFCPNTTSIFECNMILFEATQTSSSLFSLIKSCNLMILLEARVLMGISSKSYVNFGMVCHLFKITSRNENDFSFKLQNLKNYSNIKIYVYIHEEKVIPEFFNHYIHIFDTNQYGLVQLTFTKKIVFRHLSERSNCEDYGDLYKSKDHCQQACERRHFNYNYYKFLYFEGDNVTMFSSSKDVSHDYCFEQCPDRCMTYFFNIQNMTHTKNVIDKDEITIIM